MGSFIHHDRIAEKLEIARTMGLVTDYFVSPTGPVLRPDASVEVWCHPDTDQASIRDQLARLLQGIVAEDHILVVAPMPAAEGAGTAADVAPPLDATAVPVAA